MKPKYLKFEQDPLNIINFMVQNVSFAYPKDTVENNLTRTSPLI